jgi:hypothetical protein
MIVCYWKLNKYALTTKRIEGPSLPWSYGSWIYNYLWNQCISPLKLWVRTPLRRGVLDTIVCDKACQLLATCGWFSPVSSTNKTDRHDIYDILLEVTINTIKPNQAIRIDKPTYQVFLWNRTKESKQWWRFMGLFYVTIV